jgi:hypothetical protein
MMYHELTDHELTVLQSMLYEGTEETFRLAHSPDFPADWTDRYRPLHRDLGLLFIEAATELISRIDANSQPQAA